MFNYCQTYGSRLCDLDSACSVRKVNVAFRKEVRRGLGMRQRQSIHNRLDSFEEASQK